MFCQSIWRNCFVTESLSYGRAAKIFLYDIATAANSFLMVFSTCVLDKGFLSAFLIINILRHDWIFKMDNTSKIYLEKFMLSQFLCHTQ